MLLLHRLHLLPLEVFFGRLGRLLLVAHLARGLEILAGRVTATRPWHSMINLCSLLSTEDAFATILF